MEMVYLLLNISGPSVAYSKSKKHQSEINKIENHFKIKIFEYPDKLSNRTRVIWKFIDKNLNDEIAMKIGECYINSINLICGPLEFINSPYPIYAFPKKILLNKSDLDYEKLFKYEESKPHNERVDFSPYNYIFSSISIYDVHLTLAWKISKAIFDDQSIYNGTMFLKASQDDFYIYPSEFKKYC